MLNAILSERVFGVVQTDPRFIRVGSIRGNPRQLHLMFHSTLPPQGALCFIKHA